jgi:hypothetical protein
VNAHYFSLLGAGKSSSVRGGRKLQSAVCQDHSFRERSSRFGCSSKNFHKISIVVREKLPGALNLSDIEAGLQTIGWLKPGILAENGLRCGRGTKHRCGA